MLRFNGKSLDGPLRGRACSIHPSSLDSQETEP